MSHSPVHLVERVGFSATQHQRWEVFRRTPLLLMYHSVPHKMLFRNIRKTPHHMKSEHKHINVYDDDCDGGNDNINNQEKEINLSKEDWESMREQNKETKIWERQMRRRRLEAAKPTVSSSRDLLQMIYEVDNKGATPNANTSTENRTCDASTENSNKDVNVEQVVSEHSKKTETETSSSNESKITNRSKKSHRREETFDSSKLFSVKPMPKINSSLSQANQETDNFETEITTSNAYRANCNGNANNEQEKEEEDEEEWMHTVHASGVSYVLLLKLLQSVQHKRINWNALLLHYPELAALPLFAEREYWSSHYCNVNAASPLESLCNVSSTEQDETATSESVANTNSMRSMTNQKSKNNYNYHTPTLICTAPTGSGKSVLVPFYLLDAHWQKLELRLHATIAKYKKEVLMNSNVSNTNESYEMMEIIVEQSSSEMEERESYYGNDVRQSRNSDNNDNVKPFPLINKNNFISSFASCSRIVIVVSQPTRLACVELAKYTTSLLLAASNDSDVLSHNTHSTTMTQENKRVGYAVSGQSNYTSATELIYATPGYVITAMQKQRNANMKKNSNVHSKSKNCLSLEQYSYQSFRPTSLVVDEAHCRNIETDVLLAWVKHYKHLSSSICNSHVAKQNFIPLRQIIIMSATMHRQSMKRYLVENEDNGVQINEYNSNNSNNNNNNNDNSVMYMLLKEERDKLKLHRYNLRKEISENSNDNSDASVCENDEYNEKDGYVDKINDEVDDDEDEDEDVKQILLRSGPFRVERYFVEDLQDGNFFNSEVLFSPWLHHSTSSNLYRHNGKLNWEKTSRNNTTQKHKDAFFGDNHRDNNKFMFAASTDAFTDNNTRNLVNYTNFDTNKQRGERRGSAFNKYIVESDNRIEGRVNPFHQLPLLLRDDGKLIIAGLLQQLPFISYVSGSFGKENISKNMLQGKLRHLHSIYEENENINEVKQNGLVHQNADKSLVASQMYTMALNTGQDSKNNTSAAGTTQESVLPQSNALATLIVNLLHILECHHRQSVNNVNHREHESSSSYSHAELESSTILVFLPGFSEMQALASTLEIMCEKLYLPLSSATKHTNNIKNNKRSNIDFVHNFVSVFRRSLFTFSLVLLHGSAIGSPQEQLTISSEYALQHKIPLRVILATSIAESSLTIPNVRVVIDLCQERNFIADDLTGVMQRRTRYIVNTGVLRQRCGRTGRTCDGVVLHLVPRKWYEQPRLALPSHITSNGNLKRKNTKTEKMKEHMDKSNVERQEVKWPHKLHQLEPLSDSVTTILLRVKYLFGSSSFASPTTTTTTTTAAHEESTSIRRKSFPSQKQNKDESCSLEWKEEEQTGAIIASLPCPPDELQLEAAYHQLIDANILLPPQLSFREYCSLYTNHYNNQEYQEEWKKEEGEDDKVRVMAYRMNKRIGNVYSPELLYYLNYSQLTTRGYIVASFPLPHELGMFLYHALHFSCVEDAILIASAMSVPSLFVAPRLTDKSSIVYHYRNRESPAFVTNEAMLSIAQMPITGAAALSPLEQFYKLLWIQRTEAGFAAPTRSSTPTTSSSSSYVSLSEELMENLEVEKQRTKSKSDESEWTYQEKFCRPKSTGDTTKSTTSASEREAINDKCKLNEGKGHYYSEPLMLRSIMLKWYAASNTYDLWSFHITHNLNRSVMRMVDLTVAQCCQRLIELISSEITEDQNKNNNINTQSIKFNKEKMEMYREEEVNTEKIKGGEEEMCEYCGQDWGEGVSSGDYNSEYDQYCRESVMDVYWPNSYKVQLIKSLQRLRQAALCRTAIRAGVNANSAFVQWYGADEHLTHLLKTHYTSPVQKATTRATTSELVQTHPSHHFNTNTTTAPSSSSSVLLRQQSIEPILRSWPQPQLPSIYFHHPTLQRAIKLAERKEFTRLLKEEELCLDRVEEVECNASNAKINSSITEESSCGNEKSEEGNTDKLQNLIHRLSRKSTIPASKKQKLLASLSAQQQQQQQQHKQENIYSNVSNNQSNSCERNNASKVTLQKRKTKRRKISRLALLIQAQRNVAEWFQSSRVINSSTTTSLQSHRTPVYNVLDSNITNKTKKGHSPFTFTYTFGTLEDRLCAAFIATFARYTLKGEDGTHRVHHRRLIRNLSVLEDDSSQICTCNVEVKPIQSMSLPTRYNANVNQEFSASNNNNNNSAWRDLLTTSSISQALVPFFKGTGLKQIEMFASHRSIAIRFANETSEECIYSGLFTLEQLERGFDNKYVAFHASKAAMLESSFLDGTNTNQQKQEHVHDFEYKEKGELLEIKEKNNSTKEVEKTIDKTEIDKGKCNKSVLLEPVVLSPFHAKKSQEQRDALSSSSTSFSKRSNNHSLEKPENELLHNSSHTSTNELVRLAPFGVSLLIAASMSLQRIPITLQSPEASLTIDDKAAQAERNMKNTNTTQKDNNNISNSNNSDDDVNAAKNNVNNVNPVKTGHVMDNNHNTVTWKDVFGAPYTIDVSCVEKLGLHHLLPTNVKTITNQVCKEVNSQKMSTNKPNENEDIITYANQTEQIQKGIHSIHKECEHKCNKMSSDLLLSSEKEIANKTTLLANTKPKSTSAFLSIQSPINVTRMIYWKVAMPSLSWLVERYRRRRTNCYHNNNYYNNFKNNTMKIGEETSKQTSKEFDVNVKHEQQEQNLLLSERIIQENDCNDKDQVLDDDDDDDLPRICEVCNMLCLRMSFFKEHCQINAHLAHLQFAIEHHISRDQLNLINGNTSLKFYENNIKNKKNNNYIMKKSNYNDCVTSLLHKGTRVNTGNIINNTNQRKNKSDMICSSATINPQSTSYAWDDLVSKSGNINHNNNQHEEHYNNKNSYDLVMNDENVSKVEFRSELKPCRLSHLSFLNALQWNSNSESSVAPLAVAGGLTSSFANNEVELPPMALEKSTQHRSYLQSHHNTKNNHFTVNPSSSITSSSESICSHVNVDGNNKQQKEKVDVRKEDNNVIEHSRWANNIIFNATAPASSSWLLRNNNTSRSGMLTAQHVWILNQVNHDSTSSRQTSSLFILAGYLAASSAQFALALLVNLNHSHVYAIMLYDWSVFKLPEPLTLKQLDVLRRPSQGRGWCGLVHLNNDLLEEEEELLEELEEESPYMSEKHLSLCKTKNNNIITSEINTELHWCIPSSRCPHHTIHNGMKRFTKNVQHTKKQQMNLHESEQERVKMLQRASSARSYNNNNNSMNKNEYTNKNKENNSVSTNSDDDNNNDIVNVEVNNADNMVAATLLIVLHECKLGNNNIIRMSNFTERVIAKLDMVHCSCEHTDDNEDHKKNNIFDNKHVYGVDLLCTFLRHRQGQSLHSLLRDLGCQFLTPPSALSLLDLLTSDHINNNNNSKSISQLLSSRTFSEGASLEVSFTLPPILPSVLPSAEFGAIIQNFASPEAIYKFSNMTQGIYTNNNNNNNNNNSNKIDNYNNANMVDTKVANYSQLLDGKTCDGVDTILQDVSSTPQF